MASGLSDADGPSSETRPFLQAVKFSRGGDGAHDVLLDDDDRRSLGDHRRQTLEDLLDDDRREAKAQLVAEEKPRVRHQRPADRDHLLLAARERRAALVAPLGEHRKEREDRVEVPRAGTADLSADDEVFHDGERGKEAPTLRHQGDAAADELWRAETADRLIVEDDHLWRRPQQADDRLEQACSCRRRWRR